jgi:hypothetical protein
LYICSNGEYSLFDGLGSERTVTNAGQTVLGTISYDAFGQTVDTTGSSTSPYMFAATWGYRNDGDAGLMHVGARYYDAEGDHLVDAMHALYPNLLAYSLKRTPTNARRLG